MTFGILECILYKMDKKINFNYKVWIPVAFAGMAVFNTTIHKSQECIVLQNHYPAQPDLPVEGISYQYVGQGIVASTTTSAVAVNVVKLL